MSHNRDLFDGMVVFCTVVEENGFGAAAKRLGHTASHISKEVARLETRLGARLLNRTTRKISLTETGRIYYDNARRLVTEAGLVKNRIQTLGGRPFGELRMSVPMIFADGCLNHWLPEFLADYPDITLHIDVSDRRADLISEGFDLAIRIGELPPSDLIARELFRTDLMTVAAPAYLEAHGHPQTPQDLSHHTLIDFSLRASAQTWTYRAKSGGTVTVAVSPQVYCNNARMEKALALAGSGITRLPGLSCDHDLATGRLVRILRDFEPAPAGVHVLYPSREHLPAKTRAMIDFLAKHSSGPPDPLP